MEVGRLNRKAPWVGRPCSPAQRGTFRDGLCRAHERDRYGVEHPLEERVRKAECEETRTLRLEQGKGVSPTYCYNYEMSTEFTKMVCDNVHIGVALRKLSPGAE